MKFKALAATSSGYKQFMLQTKKAMPQLQEGLGEQVDRIIDCRLR